MKGKIILQSKKTNNFKSENTNEHEHNCRRECDICFGCVPGSKPNITEQRQTIANVCSMTIVLIDHECPINSAKFEQRQNQCQTMEIKMSILHLFMQSMIIIKIKFGVKYHFNQTPSNILLY